LRSNEVPDGRSWWSQTESNRRHPACKAGALPTELWPLSPEEPGRDEHRRAVNDCRKAGPAGLVGPGRLELPTSRLSGVRSNQAELRAYGGTTARQETRARDRTSNHRRPNARRFMEAKEERETETAAPRSLLEFQ
jgi:hypothetical protein